LNGILIGKPMDGLDFKILAEFRFSVL